MTPDDILDQLDFTDEGIVWADGGLEQVATWAREAPQKGDLEVMTRSWQKKSKRRKDRKFWLPKDSGFTIEVDRPCK